MDKILVHGGQKLSGLRQNQRLEELGPAHPRRHAPHQGAVRDPSRAGPERYPLHAPDPRLLGAEVERASGTVTVRAENVKTIAPYDVVRKMRASVCVLGPLLGREKEATVSLPGGCVIGDRPIDLHLKGFEALGASHRIDAGNVKVFASKLNGAHDESPRQIRPDRSRHRQCHDGRRPRRRDHRHRKRRRRARGGATSRISSTRWARRSRARARGGSSSKA